MCGEPFYKDKEAGSGESKVTVLLKLQILMHTTILGKGLLKSRLISGPCGTRFLTLNWRKIARSFQGKVDSCSSDIETRGLKSVGQNYGTNMRANVQYEVRRTDLDCK